MNERKRSKSDAEIMELLRADNPSVLSLLIDEVVPSVWPLLKHRFNNFSDADFEDIFARSLEKVWNQRHRFDIQKGDFEGWFYVIARNVAFDRLREEKRKKSIEARMVVESVSGVDDLEHMKECVGRTMEILSLREQEVVLPLFASDRVSTSELGKRLGISEGAVRALRFRGLQKLKSLLAEFGYRIVRDRGRN